MTDTQMQKEILNLLMFKDGAKYSEIHNEFDDHDLFNYHLKELLKKGYLEKNDAGYSLTEKGKQAVSLMEEDGQYQEQFKVGVFMNVIRKQGKSYEMLLYKRLKHPHYGYTGAVSGKLKWGDSIADNAARELKEEVDIEIKDFTIIGMMRQVFTNEEGAKVGDGVFFVGVTEKWDGEVQMVSEEGEYFWCDIDKILDLDKIFREGFELGLPHLKRYLKDRKSYTPYIIEIAGEKLKF